MHCMQEKGFLCCLHGKELLDFLYTKIYKLFLYLFLMDYHIYNNYRSFSMTSPYSFALETLIDIVDDGFDPPLDINDDSDD